MRPLLRLLGLLVPWTAAFAGPPCTQDDAPGASAVRWVGDVHYQGTAWPVHLVLEADEGRGRLSFPALGVSGLACAARVEAEEHAHALTLELPYGLGAHELRWTDGAFRTTATPEDRDAIAVLLAPDPVPAPATVPLAFDADGARLAGTLWLPAPAVAEPPFPLVVVGHGGEEYARTMPEYRFWAEHLTRRGYAVYLYDKRGVGESEGEFRGTGLARLTADLEAAVRAAAAHPAVDRDRIALLGGSQFGWLAFRAARRLDVAALVLSAAPTVDPVTLEVRVLTDVLRRRGIAGEALADAVAYVRLYFAAARHPQLFDALRDTAERSRDTEWIAHVPVPASIEDLAWWSENASFDPVPDIRAYSGPVFVAFGRADRLATPEINALPYEHLLPDAAEDLTLWLADEANHRLEVPSGMFDGRFRFPQLAPGYLERVEAFLEEHLGG